MSFLKTTFIAAMLCENCKALEPSESGLWTNYRTGATGWYAGCIYGDVAEMKNEIVPKGNGSYWNRFYLEDYLAQAGRKLVPTDRKLYADCYEYRDRRE